MSVGVTSSLQSRDSTWIPRFLRPAPPADKIADDPDEIRKGYAHYQPRILFWSTAGYAMFYFVRKNISIAMPVMEKSLGVSKAQLGMFLTMHGVLYGISKFLNGFVGDRANGAVMMALGLVTSAIMNVCFGVSSAVTWLGIFWMINGWMQGMGYPPCARLLTHWFEPKELTTKMALWNTSHTVGGAAIMVLCGYLAPHDWRWCFFVPAGLAILMAVMLLKWLHDTPESVGLPEVEGTAEKHPTTDELKVEAATGGVIDYATPNPTENFGSVLMAKVFRNPYIWLFSFANFFVYTIRYGVMDWGPTILKETKGVQLSTSGWMVASFEVAGLIGILVSGWLTDKYFSGRASRMAIVYMALCGVSIYVFWKIPPHHALESTALLMCAGFFVYGPQALIGAAAANLATKRAAATAVGLTGFFGYISTVLSGWGLGMMADRYGWDAAFKTLLAVAAAGTFLFILTWPAKAHGYEQDP